jgi:type IV pilus assembly protein PilB
MVFGRASHMAGIIPSQSTAIKSTPEMRELLETPKELPDDVKHLIPDQVMRKYRIAPFGRAEDGALQVAMTATHDIEALNVLRFLSEKQNISVEIYHAEPEVFERLIAMYVPAKGMIQDVLSSFDGSQESGILPKESPEKKIKEKDIFSRGKTADQALQDTSVARLVQVVVEHALQARASDIHIEPIDKNYRIRFRVDGALQAALVLPIEIGRSVVARIKILSNLKIDEKRKPQDGRFRVEYKGRSVDLRVSTFPVVEGEKVVMRILDTSKGLTTDLKSVGLEGRNLEVLTRKIREPFGIILITGPTGSGKSTTLYAFLKMLNEEQSNIVTLEDPVEYFLDGINQSQVKPEIGYTFANGLRSILRQDPNIIMVGEIRDEETAELAIHAALTGHLVFSTLHTNTAIGAVPRLIDMGIESFLLSSSLQVVMAQRLVRKICQQCKQETTFPEQLLQQVRQLLAPVPTEEFEKYGIQTDASGRPILTFYTGQGCEVCHKTGFKGRVSIMEVLEITPKIQEVIIEHRGNESMVTTEAEAQHMLSMRQEGVLKALLGLTTLAEVQNVTEGNVSLDIEEIEEEKKTAEIEERERAEALLTENNTQDTP